MLKPEIPTDQIETIRQILDPLLARLRAQAEKLPPQADSALVYLLGVTEHEDGR